MVIVPTAWSQLVPPGRAAAPSPPSMGPPALLWALSAQEQVTPSPGWLSSVRGISFGVQAWKLSEAYWEVTGGICSSLPRSHCPLYFGGKGCWFGGWWWRSMGTAAKLAVADVSGTCFFSFGNPATNSKHWVGVSLDPANSEQRHQEVPEQSAEWASG